MRLSKAAGSAVHRKALRAVKCAMKRADELKTGGGQRGGSRSGSKVSEIGRLRGDSMGGKTECSAERCEGWRGFFAILCVIYCKN